VSDGPRPVTNQLQFFVDLEQAVWQALIDGDANADARLLSDDFLGVYPSGFASLDDHVSMLDDGPIVASYDLSDARLTMVSETAALLSYQADFVRPGDPSTIVWYISSLWCNRDDRWVNTFSQDTAAQA